MRVFVMVLLATIGAVLLGVDARESRDFWRESRAQTEAPETCPVLESGAWTAAVVGEPGARRLRVAGTAALPTPGWRAQFALGPQDRRLPPAQIVRLSFAPPGGVVAQVVTEERLGFEAETAIDAFRVVRIVCGDRLLAEIPNLSAD